MLCIGHWRLRPTLLEEQPTTKTLSAEIVREMTLEVEVVGERTMELACGTVT